MDKKAIRKATDVIAWRLLAWLGALILFTYALNGMRDYFQIGFDDTDGATRSGMQVLTDHRTKCQYLNTPNGGLTPRLNKDGSVICD